MNTVAAGLGVLFALAGMFILLCLIVAVVGAIVEQISADRNKEDMMKHLTAEGTRPARWRRSASDDEDEYERARR